MSRILAPRRGLILPRRFRQQQGGFIITPYRYRASLGPRYWRISISATDGSVAYAGFTEIELRRAVGGANVLTVGSLGTATASGSVNSSNSADKAVDGLTTTGWLANYSSGSPWTWRYDFGHPSHTGNLGETILQVVIRGSWNVPTASPKDFVLQWSNDNVTWNTVLTVAGQTGWTGASDVRTFNV